MPGAKLVIEPLEKKDGKNQSFGKENQGLVVQITHESLKSNAKTHVSSHLGL